MRSILNENISQWIYRTSSNRTLAYKKKFVHCLDRNIDVFYAFSESQRLNLLYGFRKNFDLKLIDFHECRKMINVGYK